MPSIKPKVSNSSKISKGWNGARPVKKRLAATDQILEMTLVDAQNSVLALVKKHSKIIHALSKL